MRRVRLNMYRAEDEMFIIRKRQVIISIGERQANKVIMADLFLLSQWREEDAEFAKEQARRGREARERRKKKNLMRRMRRQCHSVKEEEDGDDGDGDGAQHGGSDKRVEDGAPNNSAGLTKALKSLFRCTTCSSELPPPAQIYQARLPTSPSDQPYLNRGLTSLPYYQLQDFCCCLIEAFSVRGWPPPVSTLQEEP